MLKADRLGHLHPGLMRRSYGESVAALHSGSSMARGSATGIAILDATARIAEPQAMAMNEAGRLDCEVVLTAGGSPLAEGDKLDPVGSGLWDTASGAGAAGADYLWFAVVA